MKLKVLKDEGKKMIEFCQNKEVSETDLRYRKNRDILWVSSETRKIYLKEQKNCLVLYFNAYKEMVEYISKMLEKGYAVG